MLGHCFPRMVGSCTNGVPWLSIETAISKRTFLLKGIFAKIKEEHEKELEKKQKVQPHGEHAIQPRGYYPAHLQGYYRRQMK